MFGSRSNPIPPPSPPNPIVAAAQAHRTALAALSGFTWKLSQVFGQAGSEREQANVDMAMRHVQATRERYDQIVSEQAMMLARQSNRIN